MSRIVSVFRVDVDTGAGVMSGKSGCLAVEGDRGAWKK